MTFEQMDLKIKEILKEKKDIKLADFCITIKYCATVYSVEEGENCFIFYERGVNNKKLPLPLTKIKSDDWQIYYDQTKCFEKDGSVARMNLSELSDIIFDLRRDKNIKWIGIYNKDKKENYSFTYNIFGKIISDDELRFYRYDEGDLTTQYPLDTSEINSNEWELWYTKRHYHY